MPFLVIYLVLEVAAVALLVSTIGVGWTMLAFLGGTLGGLWLARREGVRAFRAAADAANRREVPQSEVTDGMLVGLAGVLLLVPGLVTTVLGLVLLIPPLRALLRNRWLRAAQDRSPLLRDAAGRSTRVVPGTVVYGHAGAAGSPSGFGTEQKVIEGTVVDPPPPESPRPGP